MDQKIAVSGNIIAIKIDGEITKSDHARIIQVLKKKIAETGKIRLLVNVKHYPSFNSHESLYEDLNFAKMYSEYIDRMAVVSDRPWKKTLIALFGLFGGIQVEYFDRAKAGNAWEWVNDSGQSDS